MERFERDSLPCPSAAMKLVNAESRATGSGIFVARPFHGKRSGSSRYCQEGPPAIERDSSSLETETGAEKRASTRFIDPPRTTPNRIPGSSPNFYSSTFIASFSRTL